MLSAHRRRLSVKPRLVIILDGGHWERSHFDAVDQNRFSSATLTKLAFDRIEGKFGIEAAPTVVGFPENTVRVGTDQR
jgi:Zn-dependent M32 family carboxypeptidase